MNDANTYELVLLDIVITPCSATINTNNECPDLPNCYLQIKVYPTPCGRNIRCIEYWYHCGTKLHGEITDPKVLQAVTSYSVIGEASDSLSEKIGCYITGVPEEQMVIMLQEYAVYMTDGILLDGVVAGIASYLVLLTLIEEGIFPLPFEFNIPYKVSSGLSLTKNMLEYINLPLSTILKISDNLESLSCDPDKICCEWISNTKICQVNGILKQLALFVLSFMNIWDLLFVAGQTIDSDTRALLCIEMIHGISQCSTSLLLGYIKRQDDIMHELSCMEEKIRCYVEETMKRMRRELDNLVIDNGQYVSHTVVNNVLERYREETAREINNQTKALRDELAKLRMTTNNDLYNNLTPVNVQQNIAQPNIISHTYPLSNAADIQQTYNLPSKHEVYSTPTLYNASVAAYNNEQSNKAKSEETHFTGSANTIYTTYSPYTGSTPNAPLHTTPSPQQLPTRQVGRVDKGGDIRNNTKNINIGQTTTQNYSKSLRSWSAKPTTTITVSPSAVKPVSGCGCGK